MRQLVRLLVLMSFLMNWSLSEEGEPASNLRVDSRVQSCECVPFYRCNYNTTSGDHYGFGNFHGRLDSSESCQNPLDFCCPHSSVRPEASVSQAHCGVPIYNTQDPLGDRITSDSEVDYGQIPWMAALLLTGRHYICGGSLVHPYAVLTAAHCVAGLNRSDQAGLEVRLGEWDSQGKNEPSPPQNIGVREIIIHEQFKEGSLHNDVALLILERPARLGANVALVCLPQPNQELTGSLCLASGWGTNQFGPEGTHSGVLKSVVLPIVPNEKCLSILHKTKLGTYFKLHLSFLCAGGEVEKDTCWGDGGSPLVCPSPENPSTFVQAGIVSWGIGCGENIPGIYTNVALFRSWLDLQLLSRGLF